MGIKGIYGEIGPGKRESLSKLVIDKLEKTGRPLRVAIDVSIWQFQTLAGQGGSNPAIRTFFYRLVRLLSFSVQPLFVFDGPNKPPFKRGKKTGHHGASVPNLMTKQMLSLFGFPFHMAPGEAEAECALLQREGIVDAVLSEDVDTLMFGCGVTFRNWSSEGTRGNKAPTHVSVYDAKATKEGASGLDREGMVLVALMSGGDYITEGIPRCGIKVACEAARAGFGASLCQLKNSDTAGLAAWRENLAHKIRTNESGFFKVKHKALTIPEKFPNREVLGYYTNPIVSTAAKVLKLKDEIVWDGDIDIQKLREFTAEAFDWANKIGAVKFIRIMAPALLIRKLRLRGDRRDSGYGDLVLTAMNEMEYVRAISDKRNHYTVDCMAELRVVYCPIDIVGIDLDAEHDDSVEFARSGLATNDADDQELILSDVEATQDPGKRGPSTYDPTQPDKLWIPETIAKLGVPLKVEDYEESLRNPKKFIRARTLAKKAAAKKTTKKTAVKDIMPKGALDKFMSVTKITSSSGVGSSMTEKPSTPLPDLPPVFLAPSLEEFSASQPIPTANRPTRTARTFARTSSGSSVLPSKTSTRTRGKAQPPTKPPLNTNPWTIARKSISNPNSPRVTKHTTIISSSPQTTFKVPSPPQWISSSPPIPSPPSQNAPPSPSPLNQHKNQPSPIRALYNSDPEADDDFVLPDTVTISRSRPRLSRNNTNTNTQLDPISPSQREPHSPESPTSFHLRRDQSPNHPSIARKLDFSASISKQTPSQETASDSEFPSVLELLSSTSTPSLDLTQPDSASTTISPPSTSSAQSSTLDKQEVKRKKKKYIMLRQSLVGAWKEVEEDEDGDGEGDGDVFGGGGKGGDGMGRGMRAGVGGGKVRSKGEKGKGEGRAKWRYSEVGVVDLTEGD